MNCIQCGAENAAGTIACARCGTTLNETTEYSAEALQAALAAAQLAGERPAPAIPAAARRTKLFTAIIISTLILLLIGGIILVAWRTGGPG